MIKQKARLLKKFRAQPIMEIVKNQAFRKRDKQLLQKYLHQQEPWIEFLKQAQQEQNDHNYDILLKLYKSVVDMPITKGMGIMIKINIAQVYEKMGDYGNALKSYVEIINIAPKLTSIYNKLIILLKSLGQQKKIELQELLQIIKERKIINPRKTRQQFVYNYAIAIKQNSKQQSKQILEQILERKSKTSQEFLNLVKKQLIKIYLELGMKLAARKMQKEIDNNQRLQKNQYNSIELSAKERIRIKSIDKQNFSLMLPSYFETNKFQKQNKSIDEQQDSKLYNQLLKYKQPEPSFEVPVILVTEPSQQIKFNLIVEQDRISQDKQKKSSQQSQTKLNNQLDLLKLDTFFPFQGNQSAIRRKSKLSRLSIFSNSQQNYELLGLEIDSPGLKQSSRSYNKSLTISSYQRSSVSHKSYSPFAYAVYLMDKQNYKKAKNYLKKALTDDENDNIQIYSHLGECYQKLEKFQSALQCYFKIINYKNYEIYLKIQSLNRKLGKVSSSVSVLKQGLQRFSKCSQLFQAIGWIYLELNQLQRGTDYLEKAKSLDSQGYSVNVKLAFAYFLNNSNFDQCKQILGFLSSYPQQPDEIIKILLSHLLQLQQNPAQSLALIKLLYKQDQNNQNYLYMVGKASMLANDIKSAFEYLKKSIDVNPIKIQSYILLSSILCSYNHQDQALKILRQCLKITKNPQIFQLCGRITFLQQNYVQSIKYYKQSYSYFHKNKYLNLIADCYHRLKKHNSAIMYYRKSLSSNSVQPEVYKSLALLYQHVNQPNKSIRYFEKCIDEYSMDDYDTLFSRIKSYILKKQFAQSILLLQQLQQNYKTQEIYQSLGFCYYSISSYPQAIDNYLTALQFSTDPQICFNLGVCYNKVNNFQNAQRYYQLCLAQNPNHLRACYNLGLILLKKKSIQSIALLQKSLKLNYSNPKIDGAQFVSNQEGFIAISQGYLTHKQYSKVIHLCQSIIEQFQSQKFYYYLIKALLLDQKQTQANQKSQQFFNKYPVSTEINKIIGLFKQK